MSIAELNPDGDQSRRNRWHQPQRDLCGVPGRAQYGRMGVAKREEVMGAAYPIAIQLPGGTMLRVRIVQAVIKNDRGELVTTQAVQTPPIYETDDGDAVDIDVTIPADLAARWSWHWHGATLTNGRDGLLVSHWGLPGIFDQARRLTPQSATSARQLTMELV